jgi:phage tail sheath protein FI
MAFQLSPGVNVSEIDLTTVVPAVATSDGAFAGVFRWGPIGERVLITTETELLNRFAKPTNFNAETWFTAANFLSYANRLYVSRAADTDGVTPGPLTFDIAANTTVSNNILTCNASSNVITFGLAVGMYINQTTNASAIPAGNAYVITSINSTAIVLNQNIFTTATGSLPGSANCDIYFGRPETAYTAVGFDDGSANAFVANLVNQIVKNRNEYDNKDGNFDSDVIYVAKYPGVMGNSLRISVCDNANSFQSNIALTNRIDFRVGSNTALVKFLGSSNASAATVRDSISLGDQLLAGNSTLGYQYMQVRSFSIAGNTTANVTFNGLTNVNTSTDYITVTNNPFTNGDVVVYSNTSGSQIEGLTSGTSYYVVEANSTAFRVSTTPFGARVNIVATSGNGKFLSNTSTLNIGLEDPYRLRTNFVFNKIQRSWEFYNVVDGAPGQSEWQQLNGNTSASDELHLVVVDDRGDFTGTPGQILEVYQNLSRANNALNEDGSANYYKKVINETSQYIWWTKDRSTAVSNTGLNLTSSTSTKPANIQLKLGSDGLSETDATLSILGAAYDLFSSPEDIDISLVLQGRPTGGVTYSSDEDGNQVTVYNFELANYIIDNICDKRRDCVAVISPDKRTVVNNNGNETLDLVAWRNVIHDSSYAILDSGYKYQYDRYNDIYRWIPLNGDIAGVCVRSDASREVWFSPAGFDRGQVKNLVKLAFNPSKAQRDILYPSGINPVVTFPGQGTILYGDKTLQSKPSAFDRINVRRLFIVLEKAIAISAKKSLFEFNDAFTRAQFRNLVTPYLRQIKGRRGITDFLVVCDDTNNTPQIIDTNQFVGDIYIKPARSINFIQLNFIAVPTGVQFSEVVGKF